MSNIIAQIASELSIRPQQVAVTVALLDNGDTVPFIARYRKEATGELDDDKLRTLEKRLGILRNLEERRETILKSITEQGKLTPELNAAILEADSMLRLEDLYLPYKPKRRTKAQIARESGLQALADALLQDPKLSPTEKAIEFINLELNVPDVKAALEGARFILMDEFSMDANLVGKLREYVWEHALLKSTLVAGKEEAGQKFSDYFNYQEGLKLIPSHRMLALLRGRQEGFLQIALVIEEETSDGTPPPVSYCERVIAQHFQIANHSRAADLWLLEAVRFTWRIKLETQLEVELVARAREIAEEQAIDVFANNLRDLLMASPAGQRTTLGLDPGFRSGVKIAVIDSTGKFIQEGVIYPHAPQNDWDKSIEILAKLCTLYKIELISIGNGTASRETDSLVSDLLKKYPELAVTKVLVSEAGASVYSASELAAKEFPHLDVTIRGAVSIARRLQDPLAELVKIDPKAIGVGQYQHDVSQTGLARTLKKTVEDCVNAVGVDVNMASIPLLAEVSGLNTNIATNIVAFRDEHGAFKNRNALKKIPRLGPKAFEQAAGFLRISQGDNPLDLSSVHPEAYPVVERIMKHANKSVQELMKDPAYLKTLNPKLFTDETFGLPTVVDILKELEKPGRDPRPQFKTAHFKKGVETLSDVKIGMILEGVVTNVANFGAFVDIGVHQDGLVHVSELADRFVTNPREVVKAGDIVTAKVLEVDIKRKRIALSLRLQETTHAKSKLSSAPASQKNAEAMGARNKSQNQQYGSSAALSHSSLGSALLKALASKEKLKE